MFSSLLVLVLYQPHSPPSSLPPNSQLQSPVPGSPLSGWPVDRDKVLKLEPCRASLYRLGRFERRRSPLFPLSSVPGRLLLPSFFLCVVGLVCVSRFSPMCPPSPVSGHRHRRRCGLHLHPDPWSLVRYRIIRPHTHDRAHVYTPHRRCSTYVGGWRRRRINACCHVCVVHIERPGGRSRRLWHR